MDFALEDTGLTASERNSLCTGGAKESHRQPNTHYFSPTVEIQVSERKDWYPDRPQDLNQDPSGVDMRDAVHQTSYPPAVLRPPPLSSVLSCCHRLFHHFSISFFSSRSYSFGFLPSAAQRFGS